MVLDYKDGESIGVCSINCAALGFIKDIDAAPSSIKVGDYKSKKLIDAGTAHWVIGGSRPGVMTERAKWAFQVESDARSFIRSYGGKPATFDEAMEASYEDIYQDMRMLAQMKLEHARSMDNRNKIGRN
jgi:nitrous oxide reductase accessory protein NosL